MAPARPASAGLHVIVLAAGMSSRFGSPKLLADIQGRPMLAHAVDTAVDLAGAGDVMVVLGADATRLAPLILPAAVSVVVNQDFAEGIASSIRTGIAHAPPGARAVMIMLADQFAVTVQELRRLVTRWKRRPDCIVAAQYGTTTGAPAIFPSDLFPELAALRGDRGAQSVLRRHRERVVGVPIPSAALDVDTPADL